MYIIKKYSSYFCTSSLQFGFKPGYSTTLCTGVVKNVVSRYIHRGSSVLGCFLDASKAFDLVDHGMLFDKLLTRGLPVSIVRFLSSWYYAQQMCARWNSSFSDSFHVSNGVRQGGVLSPIVYTRHRCMCCAHVQCGVYNVYTSCIIVLLSHYRLSPRGGRYYMVAAVPTERL